MKKIAILTQPLGHNYGGIIQNYALQKVLKSLNYEPITIDRPWSNKNSKAKSYLIKLKVAIQKHVLQRNILTHSERLQITRYTRQFLKSHISLSPRVDSTSDLYHYFKKQNFGAVVVGSDQTWRPKYSPDIYNFFLDFLNENKGITKIAYASSFGTADWEFTETQTTICRELVQQFDAVSVREVSGVALCKSFLNVDAVQLLDPTLLLSAQDYSNLINKPKDNKQLFTYVLDESNELSDFIDACARELRLRHNTNQAKSKFKATVKSGLEDYTLPPLEGWLQGFRDAEFVITDSFHGTVFSIINQKPFFALVNKERGASRFESILKQLGLEDRLIYDIRDFDMSQLKYKIEYPIVMEKLNVLKANSLDFLKENLQ